MCGRNGRRPSSRGCPRCRAGGRAVVIIGVLSLLIGVKVGGVSSGAIGAVRLVASVRVQGVKDVRCLLPDHALDKAGIVTAGEGPREVVGLGHAGDEKEDAEDEEGE